jgi:15-cis-phytoene synthase
MPQFSFDLASLSDHRECRRAIRSGSKSFYAASRLLPAQTRQRAFALYAFCRLSDDAIDLSGGSKDALERLRERLGCAARGRPQRYAADRAMADLMRRCAIPAALPEALLEGLAWDSEGRSYETINDLFDYAARVAGSVGVMMALIMDVRSPQALARACELGVAMQLTNIARDVGEDARMGRIYLPRQWLREAGIDVDAWLCEPNFDDRLRPVVERLIREADALYARAREGIVLLPAKCRPAILAAAMIYREIGREVERNAFDSVTQRARVSATRKLLLMARAMGGALSLSETDATPPLACANFLIESARSGRAFSSRVPHPVVGWRESFIRMLGVFERLQRSERFES